MDKAHDIHFSGMGGKDLQLPYETVLPSPTAQGPVAQAQQTIRRTP